MMGMAFTAYQAILTCFTRFIKLARIPDGFIVKCSLVTAISMAIQARRTNDLDIIDARCKIRGNEMCLPTAKPVFSLVRLDKIFLATFAATIGQNKPLLDQFFGNLFKPSRRVLFRCFYIHECNISGLASKVLTIKLV